MSRAQASRRIAPLAAVLLAAASAAAGTYTVDDSGGADFTDVPAAIAAAAPGDLILVRDGTYSSFILEKGLTIAAEGAAAPQWDEGFAWVRNLPAGQTAALAGLTLQTLRLQACDGTVLVDDCQLKPGTFPLDPPVLSALSIVNCDLVVLSRSSFKGASGLGLGFIAVPHAPVHGGELYASTVIATQCSFEGGGGATGYKDDGLPGKSGLYAQASLVILQRSSVQGGMGGSGWNEPPQEIWITDGGPGSPALELESCTLKLFGTAADVIEGGPGGWPGSIGVTGVAAPALASTNSDSTWSGVSFVTSDGAPPFDVAGGSLVELASPVPTLTTVGSGLLGESVTLELSGPASAPYLLWVSPFAGYVEVGTKPMPLLLSSPLVPLVIGALGPSGGGEIPLALPVLPELLGVPVHFQAFVKAPGAAGLSTGASVILR